jgi:hypothetical protein
MRLQGQLAILAAAALLLGGLPLVPSAAAQASHTTPVILVTDPSGDQTVTPNPCLSTNRPNFAGVDVTSVAVAGSADADVLQMVYTLSIATRGQPTTTQTTTLRFHVEKGPTSLPASTANGQEQVIAIQDGRAANALGTVTVGNSGITYAFHLPDVHAVGGDRLTNVSVTATDTDPGALPVTQDDCSGRDNAPDLGGAGSYTFFRPPVAGSLKVRVSGGAAEVPGAASPLGFSGSTATLDKAPTSLRLDVAVDNTGLDPDTVEVAAEGGAAKQLVKAGGTATLALLVRPPSDLGTTAITVHATSALGGKADATFTLTIGAPPPPAPREVKPAGLAFLTPVATALGLDGPLGSYAELAVLLVLLVLLVALLFLLLTLNKGPWVRAHAESTYVVAAPGGHAQVQVAVDKVRRGVERVRAVLRPPAWPASIGGRGKSAVELAPDGHATLDVDVPHGAQPKERATLEVDLVPVGADGRERPDRAAHAKITVQAGVPSQPLGPGYAVAGIQLAGVRHAPTQPRPGETVTTTATVRNGGASPAPLRVALIVDGQVRGERRVEVPARAAQDVAMEWVAGAGSNQVKVQVFLA